MSREASDQNDLPRDSSPRSPESLGESTHESSAGQDDQELESLAVTPSDEEFPAVFEAEEPDFETDEELEEVDEGEYEEKDEDGLADDEEYEEEEYEEEEYEEEEYEEEEYEEEEEPEFSLSQLTEAYAQVIEETTGRRPELATDTSARQEETPHEGTPDDEVDDDAACPISPESIVESILFVGAPADVKLTSRKIAAVLRDVSPKEVTAIVKQLNQRYQQENAAYRIRSERGVFQMQLAEDLGDFQMEYFGRNRQARLSQAAVDVMAVVAYNQPTTREQVEKVRGKPSGSVLAQLVRRELLNVEPGQENPRVRYYSTTERFLELFHLETLADLPQSHDVSDIAELADE